MATQAYIAEREEEVMDIYHNDDGLLGQIRSALVIEVNNNNGRNVYGENMGHWGTLSVTLKILSKRANELAEHIDRMRK